MVMNMEKRRSGRFRPAQVDVDSRRLAREDNLKATATITVEEGKLADVQGLMRPYKEIQYKDWLICPKLDFVKEGYDSGKKMKLISRCRITDSKCAFGAEKKPEGCLGREKKLPPYEFLIFCDSESEGQRYPFVFVQRIFLEGAIKIHEITERHFWLKKAYEGIMKGRISTASKPRPGSQIFHTLMMGRPKVTVYLLDTRKIEGTVLFYEKEPIELIIGGGSDSKYFVPLTSIGTIFVHKYDFGTDSLRATAAELLKRGHVVIPKQNMIYDYCNGSEIVVTLDGRLKGRQRNSEHDNELRKIASGA